MSVAHAHSSTAAALAPSSSSAAVSKSPRLRCLPPTSSTSASSASRLDRPLDCPEFTTDVAVDAGGNELLRITIPAQLLPDRGLLQPHLVVAQLRTASLELRLYRTVSRVRLVDVGVWALGDYVHWERERQHSFVVLDAVDSCLRAQLPPGGGVPTFKRGGLFASAIGAGFSFRP